MRYILGFFVVSALALTVQAQADNPTADRPAGSGMEMKGGQMGMDKMKNMPADKGGGQMPMMNCPMMKMMDGATTQPVQDKPAAPENHEAHH